MVNDIKTGAPCADCGVIYPPYVMQFDHLGDVKDRDIAQMVNGALSEERIRAEMAKCEIVCANCHAERTYQRLVVARGGFEPPVSVARTDMGWRFLPDGFTEMLVTVACDYAPAAI